MPDIAAPAVPAWLERELPFARSLVDLGDVRMHVMEQGEGLPVLLLHGNPTWGYLYRKVAAALRGAPLRLIMPDLIGLGFSDRPAHPRDHTLDNHVRWMARFLETLRLERAVMVVQDWGGPIGVGAAARQAGLDLGLVVLNTVLTPPKPGFRPTAFHRFARAPVVSDIAFRLLQFPQVGLGIAQGDKGSIGLRETRAYTYPLRHLRDNHAPLELARMVPDGPDHPSIGPLTECQRFVEGFEGPVAIVWGDRDPVLGRVRSWMERLFPNAPITRTDAGHFLQEEVPQEIADAIRDVARRLDAPSEHDGP